MIDNVPLIVIVGPTASGKSSLAMEVARRYNGEIICADSRTVYRGMDIGTAKPTPEDRAEITHWGLDLIEPGERFTAADFKVYAMEKIRDIRSRGRVPILVGGTGLYVDAVVFDYTFGTDIDVNLRSKLQHMTIDELQIYCMNNNIRLPGDKENKRYVIRAIETHATTPKRRTTPIDNCIIVGITTDKQVLQARIHERTEHIFENGVVQEAISLGKKYGWEIEAMTSNIYRLVWKYQAGGITEDELKVLNNTSDWQLAKRQLTWLKRNLFIHWTGREDAYKYIASSLAKIRQS